MHAPAPPESRQALCFCTAASAPPPAATPPGTAALLHTRRRDENYATIFLRDFSFHEAYCLSAHPINACICCNIIRTLHPMHHPAPAHATHPALAVGSTTLSGFTLVDGTPEGRPILRMTSDYLEESPIHSPSKHPSPSSLPCMLCHAPAHPPVTLPSLH